MHPNEFAFMLHPWHTRTWYEWLSR
jgi:hypothetical protein